MQLNSTTTHARANMCANVRGSSHNQTSKNFLPSSAQLQVYLTYFWVNNDDQRDDGSRRCVDRRR